MKGDGADSPPRGQHVGCISKRRFQEIQFMIHCNAKRLKCPRCTMNPSVAIRRRYRPDDDGNECSCGLDRTTLPFLQDCSSNSPGISLLSILENYVRELMFGTSVNQIGCSFPDRLVHAHIK